jgi:hypothetical protein
MARSKEELAEWTLDSENLPGGMDTAQVARTIGTKPKRKAKESDSDYAARVAADEDYRQGAVIDVLRVDSTGAAVKNAIAFLSENGPAVEVDGKEVPFGIAFTAAALNNALLNHVGKLEVGQIESALSFVPPITSPRYIDTFDVVDRAMEEFRQENGRMPNMKEYKEILARFGVEA